MDDKSVKTMRDLVAEVATLHASVEDEHRAQHIERQKKLGKMTARQRVAAFVDAGSFREYGPLVLGDGGVSRDIAPADGVVIGLARVAERPVGVGASDFTALGGSSGTAGGLKQERLTDFCITHGHPLVMLWDGGGHRIQEGLSSHHFAGGNRSMQRYVDASGWIPICCAIMGPGFAGPANFAACCDFVVAVRGIASMGVAGPPLVKVALGKTVSKEELGDPDVQANKAGIIDLVVDSEEEALKAIRRFLSFLPTNAQAPLPTLACEDPPERADEALIDIVPTNLRQAYDVRRVLRSIADVDSIFELKPGYAKNLVTALGRLGGKPVGFIANQPMVLAGTLDADAADKGAHFVSMCSAFGLPLIYFIDTPGFLVGPEAEKRGLARRSAKLVFELARATVPRVSVVLRKGYGLGYMAMNGGRSFDADIALAWPTAEIAAMSVEGGVDVAFKHLFRDAPHPDAERARIIAEFKAKTTWEAAAAGFGIDDVIDPRDTRRRLIEGLSFCAARRLPRLPPKYHPVTPI